MKWETLQKKVATDVSNSVITSHNFSSITLDLVACNFETHKNKNTYQVIKSYADEVYKRIMSWDIRLVGKLRDLFPEYFPRSLRKGNLNLFIDESGDWCVQKY